MRVKKLALDQLTGLQDAKPLALDPTRSLAQANSGSLDEWVNRSQANSPGIAQAKVALEVAQLEIDKARAGHRPTVDLTANYGLTRYAHGLGSQLNANTASVGVNLTLPLYAGGATDNRIKETLSLEEKARQDLEAAQRNVAQSTRTAFFGVQSGLGQVKALEAAEQSSKVALDANQLGYQVGVRINIDVLNSQSQLFQTKRDLAKARYDVLMGQLKLRQAAGVLQLTDLQALDGLLKR